MKPRHAVYCRVSTDRQKQDSQRAVLSEYLKSHGIRQDQVRWYQDKVSGTTTDRSDFQRMLRDVTKGKLHSVIVTRLDRFSRSLRQGLDILRQLAEANVRVVAIQQGLDLTGSMGKFLSALFLALAEFERDLTVARIKEGLAARRAKGLPLGRPRNNKRLAEIRALVEKVGVTAAAEKLGCTRQNCYKALQRTKDQAA